MWVVRRSRAGCPISRRASASKPPPPKRAPSPPARTRAASGSVTSPSRHEAAVTSRGRRRGAATGRRYGRGPGCLLVRCLLAEAAEAADLRPQHPRRHLPLPPSTSPTPGSFISRATRGSCATASRSRASAASTLLSRCPMSPAAGRWPARHTSAIRSVGKVALVRRPLHPLHVSRGARSVAPCTRRSFKTRAIVRGNGPCSSPSPAVPGERDGVRAPRLFEMSTSWL